MLRNRETTTVHVCELGSRVQRGHEHCRPVAIAVLQFLNIPEEVEMHMTLVHECASDILARGFCDCIVTLCLNGEIVGHTTYSLELSQTGRLLALRQLEIEPAIEDSNLDLRPTLEL